MNFFEKRKFSRRGSSGHTAIHWANDVIRPWDYVTDLGRQLEFNRWAKIKASDAAAKYVRKIFRTNTIFNRWALLLVPTIVIYCIFIHLCVLSKEFFMINEEFSTMLCRMARSEILVSLREL